MAAAHQHHDLSLSFSLSIIHTPSNAASLLLPSYRSVHLSLLLLPSLLTGLNFCPGNKRVITDVNFHLSFFIQICPSLLIFSSPSLPTFCSLSFRAASSFSTHHYKSKKLNVRTKRNIKRSPNIVHPPYSHPFG